MAIVDVKTYSDLTLASQQKLVDPLAAKGYRYLSLAIYGDPNSPSYAGTLVLRDTIIAQRTFWKLSLGEFPAKVSEMSKLGLAPSLISVTSSGEQTSLAVVFDPGPPTVGQNILIDKDQPAFESACNAARARGDAIRSAVMYGKPGQRKFSAVWWPNPEQALWQTYTDTSLTETQQIFDAMLSQYGRPIFISRAEDGRYLSAYRGDAIGESIRDFRAEGELSNVTYAKRVSELADKYLPVYIQATGSGDGSRFSAIFAKNDQVLPRKFTATGPVVPAYKSMDDLMEQVLRKGGGRTLTCSIAHAGKIVYQRSFNWTEPGYPIAQPDSLFRIASCSKALTAIVAHQLFELGALAPNDFVQPKLMLTPPPGMKFSTDPATNASWVDKIQVKHLLNHTSGLHHGGPSVLEVAKAYGHPANYANTKREWLSYALCDMKFAPGGPVPSGTDNYSNTGYVLLGMMIEAAAKKIFGPEDISYESVVQNLLFKPLNITTARIGKSLAKDRAPKEVIYQTDSLRLGHSQVSSDAPFVAFPYGEGGDIALNDAAGGWIISSADYVRVLSCLDALPAAPIFKKIETSSLLLNCGLWERVVPHENAKTANGSAIHSYVKGGGFSGSNTSVYWREDHFSVAAFLAHDTWPSDASMSLDKLPGMWAVYQLNERINSISGSV